MRHRLAALLLFAAACSQEQPAPETATTVAPPAAAPAPTPVAVPQAPASGTYQQAMDWLRSTQGFHFELVESGIRATGDMARPTVGAERVRFTTDGAEWLAATRPTGVTWHRHTAGKWQPAAPPDYGNRIYQRVTLAFDPQKKEPEPLLSGSDATTNTYRFTNANTGELHELRIAKRDAHIQHLKIGNTVEITFSDTKSDVPNIN